MGGCWGGGVCVRGGGVCVVQLAQLCMGARLGGCMGGRGRACVCVWVCVCGGGCWHERCEGSGTLSRRSKPPWSTCIRGQVHSLLQVIHCSPLLPRRCAQAESFGRSCVVGEGLTRGGACTRNPHAIVRAHTQAQPPRPRARTTHSTHAHTHAHHTSTRAHLPAPALGACKSHSTVAPARWPLKSPGSRLHSSAGPLGGWEESGRAGGRACRWPTGQGGSKERRKEGATRPHLAAAP